jgi:chromosome segregation ATPase
MPSSAQASEDNSSTDLAALRNENLRLLEKVEELTDTLDEVMAENGILNKRYDTISEQYDSKQTELGDIMNKLDQVNNEKNEMQSELVKLRKQGNSKRDELVKKVQSNCEALQAKLQQLQREKDETIANNSSLSDENVTFVDLLHRKEQELAALSEKVDALEQELNVERETRAAMEKNLNVERETIKEKVSQLTKKMKQFKTEKDTLTVKLKETSKQLEVKEQKYAAEVDGRNRAFRAELAQLKQANREATEEKDILFDRYSACIRLLDSREQEIKEVRQTSAELVLERKNLIAELETARDELTKMKDDQAAATDPNISLEKEMARFAKAREKVADEKSMVAMKATKVSLRSEIDKQLRTKYERLQSPSQATKESAKKVELIALTELFYNDIILKDDEIIKGEDMKKDVEEAKEEHHGPLGFIFGVGDFVKSVVPLPLPF